MSPCKYLPLTPPLTPSANHHTRIILLSNLDPALDPSELEHAIHRLLSTSKPAIKGINTRLLQSSRSLPVVFFDTRDAHTVFESITHGNSLDPFALGKVAVNMISVEHLINNLGHSAFLDSIDGSFHLRVTNKINLPVLETLLFSFGDLSTSAPETDLDAENPIYHIEYFDTRHGDLAMSDLDGKVLFGMTFRVDSVTGKDQKGRCITLPFTGNQQQQDWEGVQTLIHFPTLSTAASSADTFQNQNSPQNLLIGPPGLVSNLRVRFPAPVSTSESEPESDETILYASSSDPESVPCTPASPMHTPDDPTTNDSVACYTDALSPDGVCFYCPCPSSFPSERHPHAQQPPPPAAHTYPHYPIPPPSNFAVSDQPAPADSSPAIVYYPSLTATPATTPPATAMTPPMIAPSPYDYFEPHYAHNMPTVPLSLPHSPAPNWPPYDPSSMMVPVPMGMNMNMGMNMSMGIGMVPVPMGVNLNMGVMPPHPYYEGRGRTGAGRGYVAPYAHSQYQPQYGAPNGAAGAYAHLQQPQPFVAPNEGPTVPNSSVAKSGAGRGRINGNGSYGRGSPPPTGRLGLLGAGGGGGRVGRGMGYKEREEREKENQGGCSCSREGRDGSSPVHSQSSTSLLASGVRYDNKDGNNDNENENVANPTTPPSLRVGSSSNTNGTASSSSTAGTSERNQLNIKRIEEGLDTRTTVMIKNIPNKMSDKDLMAFIERVCPRRIDFFYLRMDFQNGCNVGYAFANFIRVQDLLKFAKARLGVKWNMFSSEKVLQMSYANYQGKEALVEKFKNSAIMDEREAWRPRIFYSSGPDQGLPEPFPPPTHMRRKERSFFNRGALFVPGTGGGGERISSSGGGTEGNGNRRGMRTHAGGGGSRGVEGLLTMRDVEGLTFGKSWMGRAAAAATVTTNGGAASEEGEEFGGV